RGLEFYGDTAIRGGEIMEEIGEKFGYGRLLLFLELLDLLASSHQFRPLTSVDYVPNVDEHGTNIVHVVMGYILSNLSNTHMSEAAKLAGMSSSTFSRFFKKNSGQNFIDFVHKVRISQACNLLANSSESITEICFACGYNNISNFNRHFLKSKHVIPSVYRRMSLDRFEGETVRYLKGGLEPRADRPTPKGQRI
ncbi:MAG: AraC family transcriptional regulator, partial [Formivibrio sp.]|nr:AraC family transcriptional regulator [Formivibrio sp.]